MLCRLLPVAVALGLSAPASAATIYNVLQNQASSLCVDVPSFSRGNVLVQQYPCNYGNNQYWTLVPSAFSGWYSIKNLNSGKCLEFPGWSSADGSLAQQYTCNGGSNQLWYPVALGSGKTAYVNGYSGKCLDVASGTTQAGYHLQQFTCHYAANQQFHDGLYGVAVSE